MDDGAVALARFRLRPAAFAAEVLLAAFDGLLLHRLLDPPPATRPRRPSLGDPALGGSAVAASLRRLAGILM